MPRFLSFEKVNLIINSLRKKLFNILKKEIFEGTTLKTTVSKKSDTPPKNFILSLHRSLRSSVLGKDIQEAKALWLEHAQNKSILHQYCEEIKSQTARWEEKGGIPHVDWAYNSIKEYFFGGLFLSKIEEEERRILALDLNNKEKFLGKARKAKESIAFIKKVKVLDVGSCYNPLSKYEELDVTAIDLHPATPDVYCCDFLTLKVVEEPDDPRSITKSNLPDENHTTTNFSSQDQRFKRIKFGLEDRDIIEKDLDKFSERVDSNNVCSKSYFENKGKESVTNVIDNSPDRLLHITELREASFDVVNFSFVLDYIPSPKLRYECCVKAYKLLKSNGILCITFPVHPRSLKGNVLALNLWKSTLGYIDFERIKYEKCVIYPSKRKKSKRNLKPGFHSMLFRKILAPSTLKEESDREFAELKSSTFFTVYPHLKCEDFYDSLYILQDFHMLSNKDKYI